MLTRKVMWTSVLSLLTLFLAVGFPTSSQTTGRSQEGAAKRQLPDTGAVTARPFSGSLPASGKLQLNVERRNHTATALPDGRVLIIGGDNPDGAVGEVEMLDAKASTLTVAARLLTARTRHAATLLANGKVLVTGGANQQGALDSTELFDPQTGAFSAGPRLQRARTGHSATLLANGMVLIAGGQNEDTAEIYDPIKNQSSLLAGKLTVARKGHGAILLQDGGVLLAGGDAGNGHNLESAEIFNPTTQSFSATAFPMMLPRARAALRQLPDGKIQVIGGDFDSTMEIYDPLSGRFTALVHLAPTAELFDREEMLGAQTRTAFVDARGYRDPQIKRPNAQKLKAALAAFEQQEVGRSRYALTEIPERQQAVLAGGQSDDRQLVGSVVLLPSSPATVSTNQAQYLPGEAAVITGTGWQAGEVVTIIRQESRLGHKRTTLRAVADKNGNFVCADLKASDYRVWTSYTLTARGQASKQVAQTSYFDAPLPGQEMRSLPGPLRFEMPITTRDGSVETETVIVKWRGNSPYGEPEDLVGAANALTTAGSSCTIPNGSTFNYNANFSSIIDQPCLGIAGNPCGASDVRFESACLSFSGSIKAELCLLCPDGNGGFVTPYMKFSVQEDFKGGGTLKLDLNSNLNLKLLDIPIPRLSENVVIPGIEGFSADLGVSVKAKISTSVTTSTGFEVPFELSQGNEIGFDSRQSPAFFNNETTSPSSSGDLKVTKPGVASAKVSVGPALGLNLVIIANVFDFSLGLFGFVEAGLSNPVDTATCKKGDIDLKAGVDGGATAKFIGLFNENPTFTIFEHELPNFPKAYFSADTEPPTITGVTNLTVPFDFGQCGAFVTYPQFMFDDTCSGLDSNSITISPPTRSFFPPGTTTVTVKAKDFAGNEATQLFTVTVTCPSFSFGTTTLPDGQISTSYNQPIQVTPANTAYSYSVSAGFLPPGLQLLTNMGQAFLTGTPSQAGTYTFTITASLCAGCSVSQTYTINVPCPTSSFSLSPTTLPGGTFNVAYSQDITTGLSSGAINFAITQGALPPGLFMGPIKNSLTATIFGTPTLAGTYHFTVTATGFGSCGAAQNYTITIACGTITLSNPPLPSGTAGVFYDQNIQVQEGGSYNMVITAGALPPGVQLFSGGGAFGHFQGTPTQAGTYNFTVKATSADGCLGTQSYSLKINCPTITLNSTLPQGTAGFNYFKQLLFSPPNDYTLDTTLGNLPPGLSFNQGLLAIEGIPLAAGTWNFTLRETGLGTCSSSQNLSITVDCPAITFPSLSNGTVGTPYSQSLAVSPAGLLYSYGIPAGTLPPGLFFDPTDKKLKGTPTDPGTFNFTVEVNGYNTCKQTQNYSITIACPPFVFLPLPGGTVGAAYNQKVTNAVGVYTLALSGNLPPGVSFDAATGSLSGAPTQPGSYNFTVTATGPGSCVQTQAYSLTFVCPSLVISPATLPDAAVNTAYNQALSVSPSGLNYSFSLTSGQLPQGLSLASDGTFSGSPTQSGVFNFRVTVAGLGGCNVFRDYQLLVACSSATVNPASLPGGTVGTAYNQTINVTPAGSYGFSVASGALPTGLTLNAATGLLSGTPTQSGTFNFRVLASADRCAGFRDYTLTISCAPPVIMPASLPPGSAGIAYSQTLSVAPAGSYTFSLAQGNLPSGLTLNAQTGLISGLPSVAGTVSFIVKAQMANGCSTTQSYTLTINCPAVSLSPASLPNGATTAAYNQSLSATPAGGNYSFSVTAGALPAGLSLNQATGALTGTPTQNGVFTFTITATGFGSCSGSKAYSITIGGSCPAITIGELPSGAPGQMYNATLTASPNGTYSFAVTNGSLPPGLTLYSSFGLIYGYPATAGNYTFTVTATDASGCTGSKQFTLSIGGAAVRSLVFGDFDGDGKADLSVWRGQSGDWLTVNSKDGKLKTEDWGTSAAPYFDVMAPGDYDGDGKMDLAVFRKSTGQWLIKGSKDGVVSSKVWGVGTDVPVPGDYDGDGKTDLAVWRGAESNWYILRSSDQQTQIVSWGTSNAPYRDLPVAADFDGDGKTDIAVFRQMNGHWYIRLSSDDSVMDKLWGLGSDVPVAADYDGDGKADIAVWRGAETNWYILRSSDSTVQTISWGTSSLGDVPVPSDYDGDGKADVAVWREKDGTWYIKGSRDNSVMTKTHGTLGDTPLVNRPR